MRSQPTPACRTGDRRPSTAARRRQRHCAQKDAASEVGGRAGTRRNSSEDDTYGLVIHLNGVQLVRECWRRYRRLSKGSPGPRQQPSRVQSPASPSDSAVSGAGRTWQADEDEHEHPTCGSKRLASRPTRMRTTRRIAVTSPLVARACSPIQVQGASAVGLEGVLGADGVQPDRALDRLQGRHGHLWRPSQALSRRKQTHPLDLVTRQGEQSCSSSGRLPQLLGERVEPVEDAV